MKNRDIQTLRELLLRCPITMGNQRIVNISATKKHFIITTCGKETAWVHKITTSEIDADKIKMRQKRRAR